jgi:hypothetical protein
LLVFKRLTMVFVSASLISNGATNVYYDEQMMGE